VRSKLIGSLALHVLHALHGENKRGTLDTGSPSTTSRRLTAGLLSDGPCRTWVSRSSPQLCRTPIWRRGERQSADREIGGPRLFGLRGNAILLNCDSRCRLQHAPSATLPWPWALALRVGHAKVADGTCLLRELQTAACNSALPEQAFAGIAMPWDRRVARGGGLASERLRLQGSVNDFSVAHSHALGDGPFRLPEQFRAAMNATNEDLGSPA